MNPRAVAAHTLVSCFQEERTLNDLLKVHGSQAPDNKSLVQEFCFGVARWFYQLDAIADQLIKKPFKEKDMDVYCLILIGLYQLQHMRIPEHAAVSETVNTVKALKKPWAKAVVNGVLRNFIREKENILKKIKSNEEAKYAHPEWLIKKVKTAWPNDWEAILDANNARPPMSLRVNLSKTNRESYLTKLLDNKMESTACEFSESGLILKEAVSIQALPGFQNMEVSVQDEAAQLAAPLLELEPGMHVLDACAAPGGKTCHILESQIDLDEVIALDISEKRLEKVTENLDRLQLKAKTVCGDASQPKQWWDGVPFDRIICDVPCSAIGVIRRHPDIKLLRTEDDVKNITVIQLNILESLWPLLKPEGILLYATCAILPEENTEIIAKFLASHPEAQEINIEAAWGTPQTHGRQILPSQHNMDGFYYAKLCRVA